MRLFIAVDLSKSLVDALTCSSDALKEALNGRFVSPETYHITLAFLGEARSEQIPKIENAMADACDGFSALQLTLDGLGHFGKANRATLWQGFERSSEMESLAKGMRTALAAADIDYDDKPFAAHVTLARKVVLGRADLKAYQREATGIVDAVVLYRSELFPEGARYSPVYTIKLQP